MVRSGCWVREQRTFIKTTRRLEICPIWTWWRGSASNRTRVPLMQLALVKGRKGFYPWCCARVELLGSFCLILLPSFRYRCADESLFQVGGILVMAMTIVMIERDLHSRPMLQSSWSTPPKKPLVTRTDFAYKSDNSSRCYVHAYMRPDWG